MGISKRNWKQASQITTIDKEGRKDEGGKAKSSKVQRNELQELSFRFHMFETGNSFFSPSIAPLPEEVGALGLLGAPEEDPCIDDGAP